MALSPLIRYALSRPGISDLPVRGRAGLLRGLRWSLYPFTSYWRGTHEPHVQAFVAGLPLSPGDSCWDIGAHFGFYSTYLASRVGPRGQVVALEPHPGAYRKLDLHRRRNRFDHLLTLHAGASDEPGELVLLQSGEEHSTTSHFGYSGEDHSQSAQRTRIPVVALDQLVRDGTIRPPQFIKIDVEGHAHRAVQGMAKTLSSHRPRMLFATHCPEEIDTVNRLMTDLDYHVTDLENRRQLEITTCDDFWLTPAESAAAD